MIISASRRTDIPAMFADWFFDRIAAGEVLVANPFNPNQTRRVSLKPADVDGFVFWSKNPEPMLTRLDELQDIAYYFQFTITGYGLEVEPSVPDKTVAVKTFQQLAARTAPGSLVWRYDPIFLSPEYTIDWHLDNFAELASELAGATDTCIISFGDVYRKNVRRIRELEFRSPDDMEIRDIAKNLSQICQHFGLMLQTCAELNDLSSFGITHARCIDHQRLSRLAGQPINFKKDKNQRPACGCAASVDIGRYNTCLLGCKYCYGV